MKTIFITDSGINNVSGGGVVSLNILESLKNFGLKTVFCNQHFENKFDEIPCFSINGNDYGYNSFTPFYKDYLSYHLLPNEQFDLAVFYGCPFGLTTEKLSKKGTKIVCDLPPHNIELSREEHLKFFGEYNHPHLTDPYLWGLYSNHLRYADKVIVHSKTSAVYIKEQAKLKEQPIVLPHGCYYPETIPAYPLETTPGYFGAISCDKGIMYLLNAWLNTPHQPDTQMILGGRDAQFFQLQNPKHMSFFKKTGYTFDLKDYYQQISFGIYPSVTEGFNIPALECMAYGRPVIITNAIGMSDYITDGKQGFIIPIRDVKTIIDKTTYFMDNPDEVKRMGMEARKLAENFTWDIIQKKYMEIYKCF